MPLTQHHGASTAARDDVMAALQAPVGTRWRHRDPAEAYEALVARGLAPPPCERRWWRCPDCAAARRGGRTLHRAPCLGGRLRHPPDVGALASVAARGAGAWVRAEELARVAAPGADVVWCAMAPEELRSHRMEHSFPFGDEEPPLTFVFADRGCARPPRWPEECPYAMRRRTFTEKEARDLEAVRAAWPALRSLALEGVELVGHDRSAGLVTLAAVAL